MKRAHQTQSDKRSVAFNGVPDDLIGSTSTSNTILYDLKNANAQRLNNYKITYPQISKWIQAGLYFTNREH